MEHSFWHQRWEKGDTAGFHENDANPQLVKHWPRLALTEGSRVLVPLCGKTLDIGWLLSKGHRVVGAELSEIAIGQLFAGLGLEPVVTEAGELKHFAAPDLDIFVGDIFQLTVERIGPVDAIYDRAALVALPHPIRQRYSAHLNAITQRAPQLLIAFNYDQSVMDGPPFSIPDEEIHGHYATSHEPALLETTDVPGGLKGRCAAVEKTWLLPRR
jgi:thiopurine S-methyltransferase